MAHAVIIGGSSGIGEATAARFLADGVRVTIAGRDQTRLADAVTRLSEAAVPIAGRVVDAGDPGEFFAGLGTIDYLVLAASGAAGGGQFRTLDLSDLAAGFDGKFWVHVRMLQAALPSLAPDGSVTFLTAASARAALPGTAGLAAINGALEAMIRPLAAELAPIRVNAVSPGVIDTPWWNRVPEEQRDSLFKNTADSLPVGRVGRPEEVAAAVVQMATNGFITGTVLECAGGAQLARGA